MLGLNLRKEFQGQRLKGTAIELSVISPSSERTAPMRTIPAPPRYRPQSLSISPTGLSDPLNALAHLAKEVRHVLSESADALRNFRVILLPKSWGTNRWP